MRRDLRVSIGLLAMTLWCAPLLAGAQEPGEGAGLRLLPSPAGIACAGNSTIEDHTWTCDDVESLARARIADPTSRVQTLPGEIERLVTLLADHLRQGNNP